MTSRATQSKKDQEPEAAPARRYTTAEAIAESARRRDQRMGRPAPAKELKQTADERAAAIAADAASDAPSDRYTGMEYADLQQEAKGREVNAGGSAEQIRARLREADAAPPAPVAPPAGQDTDAAGAPGTAPQG